MALRIAYFTSSVSEFKDELPKLQADADGLLCVVCGLLDTLIKSAALVFCEELNPDEIRATKISSRWNGIKRFHWTGWAGRATRKYTDIFF
jgi:hypothetical protein